MISTLWNEFFAKIIATILAPVFIGILYYLFRRLSRAFQALRLAEGALGAVARQVAHGEWVEGPGFWLKKPIVKPPHYDLAMKASIPILMIATLKGGVGKTTLAGSLAAHFAMRWTKARDNQGEDPSLRVLLIDLDFQGSLSTMTVPQGDRQVVPSKANRLVSGEIGDGLQRNSAPRVNRPNTKPLTAWTVPAYYDLAQAENRMLVEWLLPLSDYDFLAWLMKLFRRGLPPSPRSKKDVRYLLAEALLDARVQQGYDLVIVDAPPRLTTSHVQAMCAATYLIIPTILDQLSLDAVARYVDQIATHKLGPPGNDSLAISPYLEAIGVVGTMILPQIDVSGPFTLLKQTLAVARLTPHVFEQHTIRQRPPYRRCAGERIAYAAVEQNQLFQRLREEVDRLGYQIGDRMGAAGRGWVRREAR